MNKKIAVITGFTSGIGLELAKKLQENNYYIIGICRKQSKESNGFIDQVIDEVDMEMPELSLKKIEIDKFPNIDLLINNAGTLRKTSLEDLPLSEVQRMFNVNSVFPVMLTHRLISKLNRDSKIIMITSRLASIADNKKGGGYAYRMSKSALNAASKSFSIDLADKNISVGMIHPGFVQTKLTEFKGLISPEESAKGIMERINELNMTNTGGFWHSSGEALEW